MSLILHPSRLEVAQALVPTNEKATIIIKPKPNNIFFILFFLY
jgi:hypothetical protein